MIASDASFQIGAVAALVTAVVGGFAVVVKLWPERTKLTIDAAEGIVVMQGTFIKDLRDENKELRDRLRTVEQAMASLAEAHARIRNLEVERDQLREENAHLAERVQVLEMELAELRDGKG